MNPRTVDADPTSFRSIDRVAPTKERDSSGSVSGCKRLIWSILHEVTRLVSNRTI